MRRSPSRPPMKVVKPLTQADIDRPATRNRHASWREVLEYLDAPPGGVLTTIVILIVFAVAMWGLWAAWQLPIVRELCNTHR